MRSGFYCRALDPEQQELQVVPIYSAFLGCSHTFAYLPSPMLHPYTARCLALISGVFPSRRHRLVGGVLLGIGLTFVVLRLWPKAPLAEGFASSTAIYASNRALLRLTLASDEQYRLWIPRHKMSPQLVEAVSLYEDKYFRWHPGVNPWSLIRAGALTLTGQRRIGGSTLTMQVARRLWRLDTRRLTGKLAQIFRAVQLELLYSKDEILEAYLNLVPYGGNVEGVGAASLIYFGKPADKLTLAESLSLAVIPQNPARRSPGRTGKDLTAARDRLFTHWLQTHETTKLDQELFTLPVSVRSARDLPFRAPHFVDTVLSARNGMGTRTELITTLDLRLQSLVERNLRAYVERQRRLGVMNAAVLLVDTRDMGIKAAVGSVDWFNDDIEGQVNGVSAKRSPGSTLKPFIYGMAIDQGLIHPLTVLKDTPQSFGGYSPENFDGRFVGPLTATDALNRSRNLPAIALAARLERPGLHGFLRAAGISRLASESHYGLALVLGGAEVTMEELARLYAMLANRGELTPLRSLQDEKKATPLQLLSPEAAFMVKGMLRQNPRPDSALINVDSGRLPVYWKTGTSYGFRDAWTVGIFGPYVLAVWLGNFDNSANPALIGVQMAAPLFFNLADSIQAMYPGLMEPVQQQPENLTRVDVCADSGDLPNADCPLRATTWFIPGKSPIRVSTLHRKLFIDKSSGMIACAPFRREQVREEVFEFWSSDMLALFNQAGLPRRLPPRQSPGCALSAEDSGVSPQITVPLRGVSYTMRLSKQDEQSIALQASVDAGVAQMYWFVGERYIGKTARGRSLAWRPPGPGNYTLRVVDDAGRADSRDLSVNVAQ